MGEHGFARSIPNDEDVRVIRLLLSVMQHETATVQFHLRVLQPHVKGSRSTAHRNEYSIVFFCPVLTGTFERDFNFVAPLSNRSDLGIQKDSFFKEPLESFLKGAYQIAIRPHQEAIRKFDHPYLGTQMGVHGTHFQADVTSSDDEQRLRDVRKIQRTR